jgi:hypothetical protein
VTPIFIALPVSKTSEPQPQFKQPIDKFVNEICNFVGNASSLCWWAYRMDNNDCVACDVYGSITNLNMSINITGATILPKFADGEPFELVDGTDALCLLSTLIERLNLKGVRPIQQGLEFFDDSFTHST